MSGDLLLQQAISSIRLALGLVFLAAAFPKVRNPRSFIGDVRRYEILPAGVAPIAAVSLIIMEVFLGGAFVTGRLLSPAFVAAPLTLSVFLFAVAANLRRRRTIPCGCFGGAGERISTRTAIRLVLLLLAALALSATWMLGEMQVIAPLWPPTATAFVAFIQSLFLAGFMLLLATWTLHLPEVVTILFRSPAAGKSHSQSREGRQVSP